jgi:hypothetical protein
MARIALLYPGVDDKKASRPTKVVITSSLSA